jgi:hypothetical protein
MNSRHKENWRTTVANWRSDSAPKVRILRQCASCAGLLYRRQLERRSGPVPKRYPIRELVGPLLLQICDDMVVFRCYDPSTDGKGGIHRWHDAQASAVRSAIDGALELMAREAKLDEHPGYKPLRGKGSGLAEIKIDFSVKHGKKTEQIHVRLLGPHSPPVTEFILLTGFLKKGGPDYGPACHQAHNRNKGVMKDAGKAKPCRFP